MNMPKHFFEDMVKDKRRRMGTEKIGREVSPKETREPTKISEISVDTTGKNGPRYMLWLIALVSVLFFIFALSFLFSKAEVVISPKIQEVTLNETFSASKEPSDNGLFFDLVVISDEESRSLSASGEKDVAEKATGTIVIYNNYSSAAQTLAIDTRLEGSNGKIYKTEKKVIVPGKSSSGTAGSVEVKIYASEPGSEYNSGPLDFNIVGFKGTDKYAKFYGRSKGPISGGFKGKLPDVSAADKESAISDLKITLQEKLFQKATEQIPSGFILFKDAAFLNVDSTNIPFSAENGNLKLTLQGTLYGILFNEQKITGEIAKKNIENYDNSEVFISNIKDLTFALNEAGILSFENLKNISFKLSGPAKIVWKLDESKFVADLLDKSKKDFSQIISQYPSISSATLTIRPIWARSIPDDTKDIEVIVNYPQ
jgi:hypothetical protein